MILSWNNPLEPIESSGEVEILPLRLTQPEVSCFGKGVAYVKCQDQRPSLSDRPGFGAARRAMRAPKLNDVTPWRRVSQH